MPYCSLKGCSNSSSKHVKLNSFPRDPKRREEWINNCRILGGINNDWLPSCNSTLCEVSIIYLYIS